MAREMKTAVVHVCKCGWPEVLTHQILLRHHPFFSPADALVMKEPDVLVGAETPLLAHSSQKFVAIKTYKRRWWILFLYALLTAIQNTFWLTYNTSTPTSLFIFRLFLC